MGVGPALLAPHHADIDEAPISLLGRAPTVIPNAEPHPNHRPSPDLIRGPSPRSAGVELSVGPGSAAGEVQWWSQTRATQQAPSPLRGEGPGTSPHPPHLAPQGERSAEGRVRGGPGRGAIGATLGFPTRSGGTPPTPAASRRRKTHPSPSGAASASRRPRGRNTVCPQHRQSSHSRAPRPEPL